MMDRDFPPSRGQVRAMVIALAVSGVAGLLLFGGYVPGLRPNYTPPPYASVDGRNYYYTDVSVPIPLSLEGRTSPAATQFHNVTFWTWVSNWSLLGGTYYRGNATERNGTTYPFVLGGARSDANWTDIYIAPGGAVAVEWDGGLTAGLFVLA